MAQSKHTFTPGPWKFRDGYILANGEALKVIGVQVPITVGPSRLEAIHNARLIAAAPELLAALKEALAALNGAPNTVGLHDQISAAIAKAEGGAS